MTSARAGSAVLGAVASAALVAAGLASGLLTSGPAQASAVRQVSAVRAAPNACGQPPAKSTAARSARPARAQAVLDAAVTTPKAKPSKTPRASASSTATAKASASASSTPKATATAKASASASSTPSASASGSAKATATPKASATGDPSPSKSASPTPKKSASPTPTKSASPTPTKSASPTPTKSATPSPSPTKTKQAVQLCLKVQPIATKSGVHPGGTASYAIWVWPAGGAASSVRVTVSARAAGKDATPAFTVCPAATGLTCKVGGLAKGSSDELQARVPVAKGTGSKGTDVVLSATAQSSDATAPAPAYGAVDITAKPAPSPSATPTPAPTTPAPALGTTGLGDTLPAGLLPTEPGSTGPATLPQLPSPESSPGGLFPKVTPAPTPSPSPYSAILPNARDVRVTDAAATFPFSTRLIGGEIIGLAVLAAALAIAIVRFSLRRPRPQHSRDPGD